MALRILTGLSLTAVILCGCASKDMRNGDAGNRISNASYKIDDGRRTTTGRKDTGDVINEFKDEKNRIAERAKAIAKRVEMIPGIENSTAVITGNTAIIGITLYDELSDERLLELKGVIEDAVMESDGFIDHVAVTTAPDLIKRIVDINHDGESGADDINPHDEENEETDMFFRRTPHEEYGL